MSPPFASTAAVERPTTDRSTGALRFRLLFAIGEKQLGGEPNIREWEPAGRVAAPAGGAQGRRLTARDGRTDIP